MADLTYNARRVDPRNCDYVVDPADWTTHKRGCDAQDLWEIDTGAPQGANTVEAILGADIAGRQCEVCDEIGAACPGNPCVAIYKAFLAAREAKYLEIRDAGSIGMGVFATRAIKKGTVLCEYTGRLLPNDPTGPPSDGSYTWYVSRTCQVDSAVYGNIARFANHHCTRYNCDAVQLMYGRRKVLAYRARRAIAAGEQLYVHYGECYFVPSKPCRCTAVEYPHLLGPHRRARPASTNQLYLDARKAAKARRKNNSLRNKASSSRTKVSKLIRQAGVIARSQ